MVRELFCAFQTTRIPFERTLYDRANKFKSESFLFRFLQLKGSGDEPKVHASIFAEGPL